MVQAGLVCKKTYVAFAACSDRWMQIQWSLRLPPLARPIDRRWLWRLPNLDPAVIADRSLNH